MAKFGASQDGDQVDAPTLVRALIVTGDRRTAALIGEMLQASWSDGLVVAHAGQLTDATHELLEHAASCVLLDLSEHEDRIAAVEQIRTAAPDVPIVVLAEHADEDEAVIVVKAGAQDYLVRSELSPVLLRRSVMYAIERKRLEAQLAHRALHDTLTGLPNRALFLDRLGVALDRSRRNNASIAVLFLDVDNFKQINDSLGHAAGDRLLSGLADRLQSMLRPMDTVARFGGDEFTFLFEELTSEREVILIAERIGRAVRLPIHLEEGDTTVTVSIGISIVTDPTMPAEAVIREADSAMYRAKQLGRSRYELFDETSRQRAIDRLELEGALRRALERSELRVHFQPKLSFEAGALRVTGLEALLRWQHPSRGMLAPGEFLQLAEDSGLMLEIGQYVLAHSLHQLLIWREHRPDLTITVNVSARQLEDMSFVTLLAGQLTAAGVDARAVCLDITERAASRNPDVSVRAVQALKALGVKIAIDDFGTGSSSLSSLKQLAIDSIKIHESLVGGLGRDPGEAPLVRAVIELGHALGVEVVAEGVENDAQLDQLRALGCDGGHGFLLGRPVPEEDVLALLVPPGEHAAQLRR
ncbi:MAG TPA: EAL domain-containing protein [Solirubrobacteraceae bacterium]|nr:EAL domain-containing protein [Solirubrobacteraceae bacterium]